MIKIVKVISYVLITATIYAFISGMTYNVHEHFYPGYTQGGNGPLDGSVFVSLLWPVAIPVWGIVEVGAVVYDLGSTAVEELIDD